MDQKNPFKSTWYIDKLPQKEIDDFCHKHRVEVLRGEDYSYHCYINYKKGEGSWGVGMNCLEALIGGIITWQKYDGKVPTKKQKDDIQRAKNDAGESQG